MSIMDKKENVTKILNDKNIEIQNLKKEIFDIKTNQDILNQEFFDMKEYMGEKAFTDMNNKIKERIINERKSNA